MPAFTALGGGLGGGLGTGQLRSTTVSEDNSLFSSKSLGDGKNQVAAPQFADLGGALNKGPGMLGGPLGQPHGGLADDKRGRGINSPDENEDEESRKDFSHLLQVFSIYKNKDSFN